MTLDPETSERLRHAFKTLNRFMLLNWRLGLGGVINMGPLELGRYMVVVHTGRKTGLRRQTPVNYAVVDGVVYCVAGFGAISDWYKNLLACPDVEIWLPDGRWAGVAEEVTDPGLRLPALRQVLIASGFAAEIFGLHPRTLSDEELDEVTRDYKLMRINRGAPVDGPDGPGDLAWVWLPVGMVVGIGGAVLFARRTKAHARSRSGCCQDGSLRPLPHRHPRGAWRLAGRAEAAVHPRPRRRRDRREHRLRGD